jgi:hypothetical protein
LLLSFVSLISTLYVQKLCLVLLQVLQCLPTRIFFIGVLLFLQLLPAYLAIKSNILLTIKVSSTLIYRRLRALRFVNASIAS